MRSFGFRWIGLALFCFDLVILSTTALANDYYVSPSGSDSNSGLCAVAGTPAGCTGPWKTLAHADSAGTLGTKGTIVHVADGTYPGSITLSKGGASDSVRWEWRCDNQSNANKNWPCKITGSGGGGVQLNGSAYVNFIGFDFSSTSTSGDNYAIVGNGNFFHIQNNRVHDTAFICTSNGGAGINIGSSVFPNLQGAVVTGNWIFNIGFGSGGWGNRCHGIYAVESNVIIENNVIYNNVQGYGIKYGPSNLAGTASSVISNNTLWGNGGSAFCATGPTPCSGGGPAGGCMVLGASPSGSINPSNLTVNNNICYRNPGTFQCIGFYPSDSIGTGSVLRNNLMNGNGSNALPSMASGTITSVPNFTNFLANGSGNYVPTSSGSLTNAGSLDCSTGTNPNALSPCAPSTDFAGFSRSATLDIGAYLAGVSVPASPSGLAVLVQ